MNYTEKFLELLKTADTPDDMRELLKAGQGMVNCFGFRPEKVVATAFEDKASKAMLLAIACKWVLYWDEAPDFMTDGRNEVATMMCIKIADHYQFEELESAYATYREDITDAFFAKVPEVHKTLIQTMAGMFFCALYETRLTQAWDLWERLARNYGNDWYRLPLV